MVVSFTLALAGLAFAAPTAPADELPYVPGQVLVHFEGRPGERELQVPDGVTVPDAVRTLRKKPDVAYANPDYVATAASFPNDPGSGGQTGAWSKDQWNFLAPAAGLGGVDAPDAWQNLRNDKLGGGKGVTVAVLDTGVAYRNKGRRFRRDPDLPPTKRFVDPRDFVGHDRVPLDEDGHGTHTTSTIAQATNNDLGLTGLAYGVKLMPIRVLNKREKGKGSDVAAGIRFAVKHDADVINLSLEFKPMVKKCSQIVAVCRAVKRAVSAGVTVVAAAGNHSKSRVAYPGAAPGVIAVGGTTESGCLGEYSDYGTGLDLVAPGGGMDTTNLNTGYSGCRAIGPRGTVKQYSLKPGAVAAGDFRRFGIVGLHGTSMASAHVSAAAALVIASGIARSPAAVAGQLECTTTGLGDPEFYGAGLLDAARATASRCT